MAIQGGMLTNAKARESRITAVITRADGRVEDLGTIAYWHRNPLRRLWGNLLIKLRERARR
jgi:hypothetical protein